jgi:hypothetical protein
MRFYHLVRFAAVSAVAAVSLSGCSTWHAITSYISSDSTLTCPDAAILASTSSLPAFKVDGAVDPSNVEYTVYLTGVKSSCDYDKREFTADVRTTFTYRATRAPGGAESHYRVPYYVAVASGSDIQDKKIYWLDLGFNKGDVTTTGEDTVDSTVVKVEKTKHPYEYHLLLGFQLTHAQIEFNKKMGQYEP